MRISARPGGELQKQHKVWIPPTWFRLLVITPIVYVFCVAVTIVSPVLHLVLALIDLVDRKEWRFSRVGGIGIAFCVTEFVGLTMAFLLWVASGFGWKIQSPVFQRAHNRALGIWMELVTRALRFYLGFEFVLPKFEELKGPVLAFARHAGLGDTFLLTRTFIQDYGLQFSAVGANKVLWDPFFDRLVRRLPSHFLEQDPSDATSTIDAITELSATMHEKSFMVICPEGTNWTPRRWERAIERLEERGQHDRAQRAAAMTHVLPPRTAGAIAALQAQEEATVLFVAHVGLEDLTSLGAIWRKVPLRRTVRATYWSVPHVEIPTDHDEFGIWLFDEWEKIETWISDNEAEVFGKRLMSPTEVD